MNRRRFFQATGATAFAMSLPITLQAAEGEKQVLIDSQIGFNHGHALNLSIAQVVELFAQTNGGKTQDINIQGESGHPHTVTVDQEMLIALLADGSLEGQSSQDAGHAHPVMITISVV